MTAHLFTRLRIAIEDGSIPLAGGQDIGGCHDGSGPHWKVQRPLAMDTKRGERGEVGGLCTERGRRGQEANETDENIRSVGRRIQLVGRR